MPTVGWILEKDTDAFFAATVVIPGPGGPLPPRYSCPFCSDSFSQSPQLQEHLETAHVGHRPFMTLWGAEPKSVETIRQSVSPDNVGLFHATHFLLSSDGLAFSNINTKDLRKALNHAANSRLWLRLENSFDAKAQPVHTQYDLTFQVYEPSTLTEVDRLFVEHLGKDNVHMDDVHEFIQHSQPLSAPEYAAALAEYVVGILIKDADPSTGVSVADRDYRARLNGSLRILDQYDRPLCRLICSLIRFSGNDFEAARMEATGFDLLDAANALIAPIAKGSGDFRPPESVGDDSQKVSVCPIDNGSDMVMRQADRLASLSRWSPDLQQQLEAIADMPDLDPLDREKIWALWAQAASRLGKVESSRHPLRMLAGNYCFGHWADEKLQEIEN